MLCKVIVINNQYFLSKSRDKFCSPIPSHVHIACEDIETGRILGRRTLFFIDDKVRPLFIAIIEAIHDANLDAIDNPDNPYYNTDSGYVPDFVIDVFIHEAQLPTISFDPEPEH